WTVGALAVGQTEELRVTLRLDDGDFVVNLATASGAQPDQDGSNNIAGDYAGRDEVPGRFVTDLELEKTVDDPDPAVGDEIVYRLAVTNTSFTATNGVEVTDVLPEGIAFVSATASTTTSDCPTCAYNDSLGVWIVGPLRAGDTAVLEIRARVTAAGEIVNTAEITRNHLPDLDSVPGNGDPSEDDQAAAAINATGSKLTSVLREGTGGVPADFELSTGYPNPFNPQTTIPFGVPEATHVTVEVFDLLGRRQALLIDERVSAGRHEVIWQARDLPTGVYLVRLRAGTVVRTQRVTLLK
ncbi:MAG: T9SS type A sorting domain-containing protein, partial [Rhodothermales bacterium]|nr:T9SS type A sorting domain-containing protein [Rhodothermales bacterium]